MYYQSKKVISIFVVYVINRINCFKSDLLHNRVYTNITIFVYVLISITVY